MALYFTVHSNFVQYPNNLLCISIDSNAFSRLIAAHVALLLAFDHINWSVAYISKYSSIRMPLVNAA